MKNVLRFILLVGLLFPGITRASHLMGGEVTWTCIKSGPNIGRFQFTVKLYRDCNGIDAPTSIDLSSNSPVGNINCPRVSLTDISPVAYLANGQINPVCPSCANPQNQPNAVHEAIYVSAPIFIAGVPPVTGWYFEYTSCCRNALIVNLANAGSGSFTLRALMFPYNATNTNPCFDSSPQFAERPQLATCPKNFTAYNANAIDVELDSLVYEWAHPLNTGFPNPTNYPFAAGYSFNTPLPNPAQNPNNISAVLNPVTGVVTFTPFTTGAFVTVTKVSAYKCGQKVAEIYREIQIAILSACLINQPPNPLAFNTPPDIIPPSNMTQLSPYEFIDTVFAGDTVRFSISAFDFEQQPPPNPPNIFQAIKFSATGSQFGTNFTDPNGGCPFPPCATIEDPNNVLNNYQVGAPGVIFNWQTDCNHLPRNLGCINLKSVYNFVVKVFDNFCPSPAVSFNTYTIVVLSPPLVPAADLKCADVQANGNVRLTWKPPVDIGAFDTNKFFSSYYFYRSTTGAAGPYTLVDSMKYTIVAGGILLADKIRDSITWTDATINANTGPVHYYMTTQSGCDIFQLSSDTISTIFLTVSQVGTNASLSWTPLQTPLGSSTTGKYYIEKQFPAGTGTWNLIDSTASLSYLDPISVCNDSINYRVYVRDTSSHPCCPGGTFCRSYSNITGKTLTGPQPAINPPSLRCVSVLANGDNQLTWVGSLDTASVFVSYEIYHASALTGPYTKIGSVANYGLNTFTHIGANGQNAVSYYYINLKAGCDVPSAFESSPSDTLSSMLLQVTPSLGLATLNWNAQRTPLLPSSSANYLIYYRYPPQVAWILAGDTARTTYRVPIILCDTLIEWKVEIADNSGCISTSSLDADNFTSIGDVIANPGLRCLAVQPNGDVQLSWSAAPDPNNFFAGIQVYHASSAAGPYNLLTTINTNAATGSYLHVGANANNQVQYYYLRSLSGCDGLRFNGSSDTLATMRLTVSNATLGQANLSWNPMRSPNIATTNGKYYIKRRSTGVGAYTLIDSTFSTTYINTITNCNVPYEYVVELQDNLPCTSVSSAANGTFTYLGNIINHPLLHCVSVLPSGDIQLTWELPGNNINFNEYEIWRSSTGPAGPFTLIDSVGIYGQLIYTDISVNGNLQSYSYYIKTQSGCDGQQSPAGNGNTLSSIFLTTTPVLGQANLTWTALSNPLPASSNPAAYQVEHTYTATGAWAFLGSTTNLNTTQAINDCDTTLQHVVYVNDNICVSRSNVATNTYTYQGNIVNATDLRCVSVLPTGAIQLTWLTPTGSNQHFNEFEIWRNDGSGFTLLDSVSNYNQLQFTDNTANGNAQSFSYYMLSQAGCSGQLNSPVNSSTISSIYLTTTGVLGQANLSWTALPLAASSTPQQYQVYSDYQPAGPGQFLGGTNMLNYSQAINDCDTTVTYYVGVNDNSGCVSESNRDTDNYTYLGNVIENPEIRCATVAPNGQVQITWVNPNPSSWTNFNQFDIYRNSGSGFVLIDSTDNVLPLTYQDVNANGNAGVVSYTMVSRAGCTGQVPGFNGDTLSTIYLNVTGGNTTTATFNWNAQRNPLLPTSTGNYIIEREFPGGSGVWTNVGSTTQTTFTEPLTVCIDSINYRISIADAICTSVSNVDGATFVDYSKPQPPDFRCVSVQPNGSVVLTFIPPTDTARRYNSYHIYSASSASGPFTLLDSIFNYSSTTYTHASANGQTTPRYYQIQTRSGCGVVYSDNSEKLRTINVSVFNNNGVAVINWNPVRTPELATATQQYRLFKEYPTGVWTQLGPVLNATYSALDTINVCQAVINYRVETGDQLGCTSVSSIDGKLFRDITRPVTPSMDTVSVDPLNPANVTLSWLPSPSGDVVGYVVYQYNGASWDSIGGTFSNGAGSMLHVNPSAANGIQTYSIAAFDSCGNRSFIAAGHNTMITQAKLDVCRRAIDLFWNPYLNMVGDVGQYNIYVSTNSGPYTLLATVPGNNVSYSHTNLVNQTDYCYYIQAQGNTASRTASSVTDCIRAELLELPTFSYLRYASVTDVRRVRVEALVDTLGNPDVSRYKLQRAFNEMGPFTTVGIVNYAYQPLIVFEDYTARTDEYSYYYRVITIDSCGNEVLLSNLGRTILLGGSPEFNLTNRLNWNPYEEWSGNVREYSVYRNIDDGNWDPAPVAQVGNVMSPRITDDVSEIYQTSGKFCYRVVAYEDGGNIYGFADSSVSNIFCMVQEPHLFIPNAFTPEGKNPVLKPEHIYIDINKYFFAVFNRWGQKVYETSDPSAGWDGTYDGSIAPAGTYVYSVRVYGTNGREIEKNGTVTLLR
jgi:gliding motility-associated-like protein